MQEALSDRVAERRDTNEDLMSEMARPRSRSRSRT
jgi:hypothetical protein